MNPKYKKIIIILAVVLVIILLFTLFLNKKKKTSFEWGSDIYTGFLKPQRGAWSELIVRDENNNEALQRSIYLGENFINEKRLYGIETDKDVYDVKGPALQVWYDYQTDEIFKMASMKKQEEKIDCTNALLLEIMIPDLQNYLPTVVTPIKYGSQNKYTYDTYTTKTGKTIQVAKFVDSFNTEIWLSGEVPFGLVKAVALSNNQTVIELYDFDLSGAMSIMPENQVINCNPPKLFGEFTE